MFFFLFCFKKVKCSLDMFSCIYPFFGFVSLVPFDWKLILCQKEVNFTVCVVDFLKGLYLDLSSVITFTLLIQYVPKRYISTKSGKLDFRNI